MAIADLDDLKARIENPTHIAVNTGTGVTTVGRTHDYYVNCLPANATPTTAVAPTKALNAMNAYWTNPAGELSIVGGALDAAYPGMYTVCDRLSHQGGLSGIVTTPQTTNLPTAALTRYTSGEGVFIGLSIYTQVGGTGTTVTASYTNQAGTAGRTTTAVVFGSTGFNSVCRFVILPLQAGDTGVRSVESVTVLATTATAGNFGVTLFKPLAFFFDEGFDGTKGYADMISGGMCGGIPDVLSDACLFVMHIGNVANGVHNLSLFLSEH